MSTSKIYKELQYKEIESIMKNTFDKSTVLKSYRKPDTGNFNTTYLIEIKNPDRKLILRVAPVNPELLMNLEKGMMKSEPVICQMIANAGVPVAKVLKFDESHTIVDRDYIIIEYIDSITLASPEFPQEYRPGILHELGEYTRKIHSIKADGFGRINPGGGVKSYYSSWYDILWELVEEFCDKASNYNLLDEKSIRIFNNFFIENKDVFFINESKYAEYGPRLTHNDLWAPNILVSNNSGEWEIAAIIDADRALYADREYEFALWRADPSFMDGYGIPLDMSESGKLKRHGYSLILGFMNLYAGKVEFDNDEFFENDKKGLLKLLRNEN